MEKVCAKLALAFVICAGAADVRAASILVNNANFSSPTVTQNSGYYNTGTPDDWSTQGFSAQYFENAANGGFASGTPGNLSDIQPGLSGPNYQYVADDGQGTIYQDLGVAFQPNTTYTVDISGGHRGNFDDNFTSFGLVSSATAVNDTGPASLLAAAGFIDENALSDGTFAWASSIGSPNAADFTFTTGAVVPAGDLEVYVYNNGVGRMELGGVSVTATPVPEPASALLFGLGAIGLFALARRRRA